MKIQQAKVNIKNWFWSFKEKLVDEYPEYHSSFDKIVSVANRNEVVYEVFEFANRHLEVDAELKGGIDNLSPTDYMNALEYGCNEWVK